MKVVVVGAGAIGGYVGGRLAQRGHDVTMVARGDHLDAMQADGLWLVLGDREDHVRNIRAVGSVAEAGPCDLVLFTVKLPDTTDAARDLPGILASHTRIITLQNGIDGKPLLESIVGPGRVSAGTIFLGAFVSEPGKIVAMAGMNTINIDALDGDPVIAEFASEVNAEGSLRAVVHDDVDLLLWSKFIPLSSFSGLTSLTRLPLGMLRRNPENRLFFRQLIDEGLAVARSLGHDIPESVADVGLQVYDTQPDEQKSSLLIDIEAGKKNEIAFLSGRLHRLGQEKGVPTPGHSAIWIALAAYANGAPDPSKP